MIFAIGTRCVGAQWLLFQAVACGALLVQSAAVRSVDFGSAYCAAAGVAGTVASAFEDAH